MIRLSLVVALVALVVPAIAAAKEPSQASISGPGFSKTLKMTDIEHFSGSKLGELTEESGFFPSAVGQSPNPMLPGRPSGKLGPRYTIVWTVPGPPGNSTHRVRQDLYPYARGGAVTYTKPGQPIFDMTTVGGWYRNPLLKGTLVGIGLAKRAPSGSAGNGTNYALLAGIGIPGALALAGAGFFVARRRRSA
jgi:LPXTG-motif cell wall-anchored protein